MATDKNTIGVTSLNGVLLDDFSQAQIFADQMDAAKFALSLAIRSGSTPDTMSGTDTKWNVGSFDKDGNLRALIRAFFPDNDTPYRAVEYLLNAGLDIMRAHISENRDLDLLELIELNSGNQSKP